MKSPIKAIIVDDQIDAIDSLKQDLHLLLPNDIQIIGESTQLDEAVILFKETKPDLIFLDIDLKIGTGFDFLEKIAKYEYSNYKIIFTTAFNQFAIKAIKFSAFDYLLKPIDSDDLQNAINRLKNEIKEQNSYTKSNIELLIENNDLELLNKKIAIPTQDKIYYKYLNDIIRCESSNNYTKFYFKNETSLLVSKTIKEYESILQPYNFVRSHQQHLTNLRFVDCFIKNDGGYLMLTNGDKTPVSRRKREEVLNKINSF